MINRQQVELKHGFFQQSNALLFRPTTTHTIESIVQPQKNVQLRIIAVARQSVFKTKRGQIVQFLVADETGSCYMNFFNETGRIIEQGDILYVTGVYSSYYKDMLIIYQGTCSIIRRVGKWYMKFNLSNNISLKSSNAPQVGDKN